MDIQEELVQYAKALTYETRLSILMAFPEAKLHKHVKALFERMEPSYSTAITYGANEHGKDLVIVKRDNIGIDVTAVVVKCWPITEITAGAVDQLKKEVTDILKAGASKKFQEVESLVGHALEHPAEAETIFKDLPVNKIMVIVAGEFSLQARKQLVADAPINLEDVRDIDWLIGKCTEHYPQVFFEQEVIESLHVQIARLEAKHWLGGKRKNLSDYYVEILVAKTGVRERAKGREVSVDKPSHLAKLKEIIEEDRRVLLVGDPSSGKSAALVRLAIQMFRDALMDVIRGSGNKRPFELPILVEARKILEMNDTRALMGTLVVSPELESRMAITMLMVDALDEVPSSKRQQALDKAAQFADELNISLLVTSRKVEMLKTPPAGFTKYELLPFEVGQALKLFAKLAEGNKDRLKVLKSGLEKIQFKMPMVPLSLILLFELVEEKREIPESVNELYDRFSDIAFGRWDKDKGVEVTFELSTEEALLGRLGTYRIAFKRKD
ncbi:MAG: restriction endonuclease [Nitrospira sp.]